MSVKIKALRDKQKNLITLARQKLDEITDDTPEARAKELDAEHDKIMAEHDEIEARIKREEKLEAAEKSEEDRSKSRRPGLDDDESDDMKPKALDEKRVFKRLLQLGSNGLTEEERGLVQKWQASLSEEQRALGVATGAAGAFTVPQGFSGEIDKALLAWGPMLDPAVTRVLNTDSGNTIPWPTMNDTGNSGRLIAENTTNNDLDVAFASVNLGAFMYTSDMVKVSYQLLMDTAFNVETEILNPAFGERIGRIANTHLTTGTGTGQPNGIVTASGLGKTTAAVAAVTADEIIDFYHSIDPAYRGSPMFRFMFNDSTLLAVRKLKDAQNRYLIDSLKDDAAVLNIAGISVPYAINQAVASMATGNRFMVGGDFSRYIVRKVRDYQIMTLRERFAEFFQVAFLGFARLDGQMLNAAAIKHMKNA